jgi:hypothetical protein
MVLSNKQISRYSKLLTIERKEIQDIIEAMNISDKIKKVLDKKMKNIFHYKNRTPEKDFLNFVDDNIDDI